jgi:hypothetical protein
LPTLCVECPSSQIGDKLVSIDGQRRIAVGGASITVYVAGHAGRSHPPVATRAMPVGADLIDGFHLRERITDHGQRRTRREEATGERALFWD